MIESRFSKLILQLYVDEPVSVDQFHKLLDISHSAGFELLIKPPCLSPRPD